MNKTMLVFISFLISFFQACSHTKKNIEKEPIFDTSIDASIVACQSNSFLYFEDLRIDLKEKNYIIYNNTLNQNICLVKHKTISKEKHKESDNRFILCSMNDNEFEFHGLHFYILEDAPQYIQAVNNKGHIFNFPRLFCKFFIQKK